MPLKPFAKQGHWPQTLYGATLLIGVLTQATYEPWWTEVSRARDGVGADCEYLASYKLDVANGDTFPEACQAKAIILGADTFDAKPDGSKCYLKKCGSLAELKFSNKFPSHVYSVFAPPWAKVADFKDGFGSDCEYLGSYELDVSNGDVYPETCQAQAFILGGDTFDAKPDGSKCYLKKCGSLVELKFTSKYPSHVFSIFAPPWAKITDVTDGVGADCEYMESYEVDAANGDTFPEACQTRSLTLGADTFDAKPDGSKCYMKKCGSLAELKFSSKYPSHVYSILVPPWAKVTDVKDGVGVDCEYLQSYELDASNGDVFPETCQARALISGADSFDAKLDGSKCYLKKCGSLAELKFTTKYPSHVFSILTAPWAKIADVRHGAGSDCEYLQSYELNASTGDEFPEACQAQALIVGADTFDAKPDGSKCYFKRCRLVEEMKFTGKYPSHVYTMLHPRTPDTEWSECLLPECEVDFHLYWTSELRGRVVPSDGTGAICDPATSVDSQGEVCFGGTARRITKLNQEKERWAAANQSAVVFDLAGSSFGTSLSDHPKYPIGHVPAYMMNLVPYDFCLMSASDFLLPGNSDEYIHEAAWMFGNRTCPWLVSNVDFAGRLEHLNAHNSKYKVFTSPKGAKIGFVGMFPHVNDYVYNTFKLDEVVLDARSPMGDLLDSDPTKYKVRVKDKLKIDTTSMKDFILKFAAKLDSLDAALRDVYFLGTHVNVDILAAHSKMMSDHPDLKASILLVGRGKDRFDQIEWMLEHGPFDVVIQAEKAGSSFDPMIHTSSVSQRKRLYVKSGTKNGLGELHVRLDQAGVARYDFKGDVSLGPDVASDEAASAAASKFYEVIRAQNARSYGILLGPLVGTHRVAEAPPSRKLCYYTDCPHGDIIGKAMLWKARAKGIKADLSLSNLGGVRSAIRPKREDENEIEVTIADCDAMLSFKNLITVVEMSGEDVYKNLEALMVAEDRGAIFAGIRVAIHEPCWDYVDRTDFSLGNTEEGPPGSTEERNKCAEEKQIIDVHIVDIEVQVVDYESCVTATASGLNAYSNCSSKEWPWQRLQKATTYKVALTSFNADTFVGVKGVPIAMVTESQAVCDYIAAHSPVQVDTWDKYRDRGEVQYQTAADGWSTGNRVPHVKSPVSFIAEAPFCPDGMYTKGSSCSMCPAGKRSVLAPQRDTCEACLVGRYNDEAGQSACRVCVAGRSANESGLTECHLCEPGFYSDWGAYSCTACMAGFSLTERGKSICIACEKGRYSSASGSSGCTKCGKYRTTQLIAANAKQLCICDTGAFLREGRCVACPQGSTTSSLGSVDIGSCLCEEGYYMSATWAGCHPCPLGSTTMTVGSVNISFCMCERDTYMSDTWSSCQPCPAGSKTITAGGNNVKSCLCERGLYMPSDTWIGCQPCKQGMECEEGSAVANIQIALMPSATPLPYPKALKGYFTQESEPLHVYKCTANGGCACPGGAPGQCAERREGLVCHRCPAGQLATPCGCEDCTSSHVVAPIAYILASIGCLVGAYHMIDSRDPTKQRGTMLEIGITLGQMVAFVQQLGVLDALAVAWPSPFKSFLSALSLFIFDLDVFNLSCFGQVGPAADFALRVSVILILIAIVAPIHVCFVLIRHQTNLKERWPSFLAVTGSIFLTFFISISTSVFTPFRCQDHPNNEMTLRDYDGVLCWQGGDHMSMVVVSCIGLLIPFSFLAWTVQAVLRYPQALSSGDVEFMRTNAFLFFRFRNENYWYILVILSRNLIIALTPIVPGEVLQIILFSVVVLISLVVQSSFRPWRADVCNGTETFGLLCVASLMTISAFFVETDSVDATALALVCMILCVVVLCCLGTSVLLVFCWRLIHSGKTFTHFLCHFKAGAGSFARLLKMSLTESGSSLKVFLDSDDLRDLSMLFGYVEHETQVLVVLCSEGILMRKWCIGEISTACAAQIDTTLVLFPNFTLPENTFIDCYEIYNPEISELCQYGISLDMVRVALSWIRRRVRTFQRDASNVLPPRITSDVMDALTKGLRSGDVINFESLDRSTSTPCLKKNSSTRQTTLRENKIVADLSWSESASTALILQKLLFIRTANLGRNMIPTILEQGQQLLPSTDKIICICSTGCFLDIDVVRAVFMGAQLCVQSLPVVCEEGFRFPSPEMLEHLKKDVEHVLIDLNKESDGGLGTADELAELVKMIFKEIAVVIQPASSTLQMLEVNAGAIIARLQTNLHSLDIHRIQPVAQTSQKEGLMCQSLTLGNESVDLLCWATETDHADRHSVLREAPFTFGEGSDEWMSSPWGTEADHADLRKADGVEVSQAGNKQIFVL